MATENPATQTVREYIPEPGEDCRVELFVKTLAPAENYDAQNRLVSRLISLTENGALGDLEITVWGDQICTNGALSRIDRGKHIVGAIGDFYSFAADEGVNISPFFTNKTVEASLSGQSFKCIVPPNQCTAMYQGDRLVGVFPCVIGEEAYTVRDVVEQLEATGLESKPKRLSPE